MNAQFPDITSFGTLLGFAQALEEAAAALAAQAAAPEDAARALCESCAKMHAKRARELARLRRERLNEVVLQPVAGMDRADYLPDALLPEDREQALAHLGEIEERAARFYRDACRCARHVLGGLERSFAKMAAQSAEAAVILRTRG